MSYSQQELEDAASHIIKSEEIRKNKELMKELEPYLKEHIENAESALSLKDLWKKGLNEAVENEAKEKEEKENSKLKSESDEDENDGKEDDVSSKKDKGEKVSEKHSPKIMSKD